MFPFSITSAVKEVKTSVPRFCTVTDTLPDADVSQPFGAKLPSNEIKDAFVPSTATGQSPKLA